MKILIQIKNRKVKLVLFQDGKEIDFLDILDEMRLSENLLVEIDKIIKKNNLQKKDIEKIEVDSDQEDNFTTSRIAKSVANAWNFGIGNLPE